MSDLEAERAAQLGRYERLKNNLPIASDHQQAVQAAFERLPGFYTSEKSKANKEVLKGLRAWDDVERLHQIGGESGRGQSTLLNILFIP